jgi:hypothetical protein
LLNQSFDSTTICRLAVHASSLWTSFHVCRSSAQGLPHSFLCFFESGSFELFSSAHCEPIYLRKYSTHSSRNTYNAFYRHLKGEQTVAGLVTALASVPLDRQGKVLLLRSSLQARLTHLTCITPWSQLSTHVAAAKRQVLLAALDLVEHPPLAATQSDPVLAQLALPLRSGGFGLRLTTSLEADAAFLVAAGATKKPTWLCGRRRPPFAPSTPPAPTALRSSLGGWRFTT